jgi:hypothetical protein
MNKPTPSQELISEFKGNILTQGGKIGTAKIKQLLNWREEDFDWVKNYLLETGQIKLGRGRGGSLQVNTNEQQENFLSKIKQAQEEQQEQTETEETFDLESLKKKFKAIPEETSAFKPGMKVSRLQSHLFTTEEYAWKYMNHYVVTEVHDDKIFVVPKNVKGAEALPTKPVRFYTRN